MTSRCRRNTSAQQERMEAVEQLRKQLDDEDLNPEQRVDLLCSSVNALQSDSSALTRVKSQLYHSGILSHCVLVLAPDSRRPRGNWAAAATLAQLTSSVHYEQIQMCDDVNVSLLCVQMWIQTCTAGRDFLSSLSDDSILLLLNEVVGLLAISSDAAVSGASVRLILLMANQLEHRLQPLLLSFRDQVQSYLQECEQRAAVVIQSFWRGFAERRRYNSSQRDTLRQQRAARTLQRAVRRFLQKRSVAKALPITPFWIGQRDAPPLSVVTATVADSFLSPSGPYAARARDAHNAVLQASRLPWWRTLGEPADALCPAQLQELEAEFGGLFVGGSAKVDRPLT
ncbi:hypothetical protein F2P81_002707 [Scophthalmus maximus]|uniref:IQ calmodulin-binding motif-containing protein 1 n=1 Tax=Scophthalmus maximus TaxID=52904 RepID=A0A6A4TP54_SCOMX|nr:hypothetical protein F2P81_002707 [Scophthalmus maximus]